MMLSHGCSWCMLNDLRIILKRTLTSTNLKYATEIQRFRSHVMPYKHVSCTWNFSCFLAVMITGFCSVIFLYTFIQQLKFYSVSLVEGDLYVVFLDR